MAAAARSADRRWLADAIDLSRRCPPSATAFSVGAILVDASGRVVSTGYSRELDPADHAEEVALARGGSPPANGRSADDRHADATLYSSLEPCAMRRSRPTPCAELIIASGIRRVVIAWQEPPLFVPGGGAAVLRAAGVEVEVIAELAEQAREVNAHLLAS